LVSEEMGFTVLGVEPLGDYGFLRLENHRVKGPTGEVANRLVIVHPGAVAVVAIVDDDIILIDQYRTPVDSNVLEIPAGKLDAADVSTEQAARRELLEETGYEATTLTELTAILTTVGFTDEKITIYLADGLTPGDTQPDGIEEFAATVVRIPFEEAVRRVISGEIQDAKTIAGVMLTDAHRRRER
jgi:ADP-ribose diphosphatase